ncbi:early nodulin-like protein 1 [Tripterygium wilfordii]|uniref:early nodulin-like protein 1 n=1 Tax=Tripterygium wilfordii TaxID=458696 RepID=UPI0018F85FB2|nr:early nodulin-like protein 1 [Tripterygium wilfordii]
MALKREALGLVFMISLMVLCGACYGAVYRVGDSAGWTNQGGVDYKSWASSKTFYVGDIIVFEYDKGRDNVVLLSPLSSLFCFVSHPMATYSTGKDYVTLYKPGFFNFASGFPGHCKKGERLYLLVHPVPSTSPVVSPAPSPNPFLDWSWIPMVGSPAPGPDPTVTQCDGNQMINFYDFPFCNTYSPVVIYSGGSHSITLNRPATSTSSVRGAVLLSLMVSLMALCGSCYGGIVYKVGESAGWSSAGFFDYKTWSSTKTFHVGDTIGT